MTASATSTGASEIAGAMLNGIAMPLTNLACDGNGTDTDKSKANGLRRWCLNSRIGSAMGLS